MVFCGKLKKKLLNVPILPLFPPRLFHTVVFGFISYLSLASFRTRKFIILDAVLPNFVVKLVFARAKLVL